MSTSIFRSKDQAQQALDDVKDHAKQAAHDVRDQARETADDVADHARRIGSNLKENASDALQRATGAMRDARDQIRTRGEDVTDQVRDFIREKPLAAVVGFAAFGLAVGYLLRPSPRKSSWFDASDISDVLEPLKRRARAGYRDLRGRGSDVIGAVQDRLPDHPMDAVVDRARSVGRNFKFW
ncbi:MAG: hypothetical protein QM755_04940 [Luteolibacter sp.]